MRKQKNKSAGAKESFGLAVEEHVSEFIIPLADPEEEDFQLDTDGSFDEMDDEIELDDSEEYSEEELDRRKTAYSGLKKSDKIYNNTYNLGYESNDEDDDPRKTNSAAIKIDSGAAEFAMYDPSVYSEHVDLKIIQRDIYNFMYSNDDVIAILGNDPEKKKFTKIEINRLFEIIHRGLTVGTSHNYFISPIHVLDAISTSVGMEYKKLFDQFSYENKEVLLIELNKTYNFLDNSGKNYKMF